jgi:flagellar hook assembly protein FlgD
LETWAPVPTETALLPNYPNPFNPDTWLPYRLAKESAVAIRIYNHSGTPIRTLSLGVQGQGDYLSFQEAAYWDGRNDAGEPVGSGVYWCTLDAGDYQETRKMVIQK